MPSKKVSLRAWCVNLSLIVGSLILVLGLAEGGCRLYGVFAPRPATSLYHFRISRPPPYQNASYFSRAFIQESFFQPGGWKTDSTFGWIPNDYQGRHFNVVQGKRKTTDSPPAARTKSRVLVFGGSTTYCSEVPDALTICSYLQRMLNENGKAQLKVENLGATTITIRQQVERLKLEPVGAGDVVLFYDGVNDVIQSIFYNNPNGNIIDESRRQLDGLRPVERFLFKVHRRLAPYSAFVGVFLNPIKPAPNFREIDPAIVEAAARQYHKSIGEAAEYCRAKQVKFAHFLQPNLFVASSQSAYEKTLLENPWLTPPGLGRAFELGYPALRRSGQQAAETGVPNHDLSSCLDSRKSEVYLDYCHVNHAGNEIIARALFERVRPLLD